MINGTTESTPTLPPESGGECSRAMGEGQQDPDPARAAILDRDEVDALRAIVEGTARSTGAAFFQSLVRHLASAIGVNYAFVAEFAGSPTRVRTLAYWSRGRIRETSRSIWPGPPARTWCEGGCAIIPRESARSSRGSRPHRPEDRELPGRAVARRRRSGARPPRGLRRAALARRAPPAVHLPDLRHPCRRRARTAAGREAARRERAPLPGALRGSTQCLCGHRHRSAAPERQPPRHAIAGLHRRRAGGPARARPVRRDAGRAAPRRGGAPRRLRRPGDLRPGAGDAPTGRRRSGSACG